MTIVALTENRPVMKAVFFLLYALLAMACAASLSSYLSWQPVPLIRIVLFLVLLMASKQLASEFPRSNGHSLLCKKEIVCMAVFASFLSVSIILGHHIVINSSYSGTIADNYILPYSLLDVVAFALNTPSIIVLALSLYLNIKRGPKKSLESKASKSGELKPLGACWVISLSLIYVLAWIPYLLAYWPGLIFSDSISSLNQVLGLEPYSNHHPLAYTLIVKGCIVMADFLGLGTTWGIAMYSLVQMGIMACCFGWLARWVVVRTNLSPQWGIIISLAMAFSPYMASYSIAMWKDPIFSCSIVATTLLLMDYALSRGSVVKETRSWMPLFLASLLALSLLRSNGIYIIGVVAIGLCVYTIREKSSRRKFAYAKALVVPSLCVIAFALLLTGPLYNALEVQEPSRAEKLGIPLNQMARVVAVDGIMSEEDAEFMASLLPIDKYKDAYRPCCTDELKWDSDFNASILNDGILDHWLSMFLKNPRVYFEAWELQTCGFWTINQQTALNSMINIAGGVPRNTIEGFTYQDIAFDNKLGSAKARDLLPLDEWSVPLGLVNWCIAYLALCLFLLRKPNWTMSLLPIFGLILSLLAASPIYYWQRYEAAGHFLIPFFLAIVLLLMRRQPDSENLTQAAKAESLH